MPAAADALAYTLRGDGGVTRNADAVVILPDTGNGNWLAYLAWRAAGNAPGPAPVVVTERTASGNALLKALTDEQAATLKPRDMARLSARGSDAIPQSGDLVVRIATKLETTPAAWFDLALSGA